jgi:hypothetical protein
VLFNSSAGGFLSEDDPDKLVPVAEWFHIAFTRDASDLLSIWLNGEEIGSATVAGQIGLPVSGVSSLDVGRGHASDNADINAYFDQIRMTKACRYTAPFTPPTEPFPTSGS